MRMAEEKKENALDRVMRIGKEIQIREDAKGLDVVLASNAVEEAESAAEQAAIAGDEVKYAIAKDNLKAAQNRLEIAKIQAKNKIYRISDSEIRESLSPFVRDHLEIMNNEFIELLSIYDSLCEKVEEILALGDQYNSVMHYWKYFVAKSNQFPYQEYASLFLPMVLLTSIKNRKEYTRKMIKDAIK